MCSFPCSSPQSSPKGKGPLDVPQLTTLIYCMTISRSLDTMSRKGLVLWKLQVRCMNPADGRHILQKRRDLTPCEIFAIKSGKSCSTRGICNGERHDPHRAPGKPHGTVTAETLEFRSEAMQRTSPPRKRFVAGCWTMVETERLNKDVK